MRPKINQITNLDFSNPLTKQLDNNVNVYFFDGGLEENICMDFIFKGGSFTEKKPLTAKLTSLMLNEGTKNYSSKELMDEFNFYGVDFDVDSGPDSSHVSIEVLNKHVDNVLPLVKEIFNNAIFPKKEFDTQIDNYINSLKILQGKNMYIAKESFLKAIWGENHPYGSNESFDNINKITQDDLIEYYQENYNAKHLSIIVSGNIEKDLFYKLNNFFGSSDLVKQSKHLTQNRNFKSSLEIIQNIEGRGKMQSAIAIGFRLFNKKHPDYRMLQIANYILGGGSLGSRLMDNIREKRGYTYGIYAGSNSFLNDGYFRILTEVGNEYKDDTLKQIEIEINRMKNEQITLEELQLAKNSLLGDLLELTDGPYNKSKAFQKVFLYDLDMNYYKEFEQIIKNATIEDIQDISKKYYNFENMYKIVVAKK